MPDPQAVNSMFSRIARRYDVANRLLSGGIDIWWRHKLVKAVAQGSPCAVLDLATGSGDVAFVLAKALPQTTSITGMDFCQPMLDEAIAKQKAQQDPQAKKILFKQGDGMALAVDAESFDAATISFGLRNMSDRVKCLSELHRALKPDGRVFVLEFSQPYAWFKPIYFFYLRHILPWFAGLITGDRKAYVYLNETIESFPDRKALGAELLKAGFSKYVAEPMTFGIVALHIAQK